MTQTTDLVTEGVGRARVGAEWSRSGAEPRPLASLVPYITTSGKPIRKIRLATITLTKPMLRKGWRSTSVTRSRKPTPEFMRSRTREASTLRA